MHVSFAKMHKYIIEKKKKKKETVEELHSRIEIVYGCFVERGDSILGVFHCRVLSKMSNQIHS